MPPACCVTGCKSKQGQTGVTFFPLPLNKPTVLTQWLIVLDRRDWIPKPSSRICSSHFTPDDFLVKPANQGKRLKPEAVPSLFPDPDAAEEETPEEVIKIKQEPEDEEEEEPQFSPKSSAKSKTPREASIPTPDTPSGRPRRAPKVSSKMKDYILLDDIKKNTPKSEKTKTKIEPDEKAAQELLSILEDSENESSDESSSVKRPSSEMKRVAFASTSKPAPGSVKRAKLALLEKASKPITVSKSPEKPGPLSKKKPLVQLNRDDNVVILSYDDLHPISDISKDDLLYSDGSEGGSNQMKTVRLTKVNDLLKNSNLLKTRSEIPDASLVDSEVSDSDSGVKVLSDKSVDSHIITKVSKNFKITSPVKRKKRFKTVAEIVVRTDNTGSTPSVSIEKLTSLEGAETPRKKAKTSLKTAEEAVNNVPSASHTTQSDLDWSSHLAGRISDTIKQMKLLEKVKGNNDCKLTVLVTTLPPVKENELLIIKKKNTETSVESSKELKVAISNSTSSTENPIPILGAVDVGASKSSNKIDDSKELTEDEISGELNEDGSPGKALRLPHDHTYISPESGGGGEEDNPDEQSKEIFSKLRLSDEEISYRRKVLNKLRLLKETIKRKNEALGRQKRMVALLERALREERAVRGGQGTKRRQVGSSKKEGGGRGYRRLTEEDDLLRADSGNPDTMDDEDNMDDSDDENDRSGSPITYICEPAIDAGEKIVTS